MVCACVYIYIHTHTHTYKGIYERFIWWCYIYCWWLFMTHGIQTLSLIEEVHGIPGSLWGKMNLIWSHSLKEFWSAHELFSWPSCIKYFCWFFFSRITKGADEDLLPPRGTQTFDINFETQNHQIYRSIQRLLAAYKEEKRGPTLIVIQSCMGQ